MNNQIEKKIDSLSRNETPSAWRETVRFRKENSRWLNVSTDIALSVLDALESKKMSKREFASLLGVSRQQVNKIVKGRENLTLRTISKIEEVLGVELLPIQFHPNEQAYISSASFESHDDVRCAEPESGYDRHAEARFVNTDGIDPVSPVRLTLKSIAITEFSTVPINVEFAPIRNEVKLTSSFYFGVKPDISDILVSFKARFLFGQQPFVTLHVRCEFSVEKADYDRLVHITPTRIRLPRQLMAHLSGLTAGTARGILYANLAKTKLDNIILPIIDVDNMITTDVEFRFSGSAE